MLFRIEKDLQNYMDCLKQPVVEKKKKKDSVKRMQNKKSVPPKQTGVLVFFDQRTILTTLTSAIVSF